MECTLCGLDAAKGIGEDNNAFCCRGCRTVWHLLTAKGIAKDFLSHPVYIQAVASGLISNPLLKQDVKEAADKKRLLLEIREMWCPSCAEVIEILLPMEKGVLSCHVDYTTDLSRIEYDPKKTHPENIFLFIKSLGYTPLHLENILSRKSEKTLSLRFFVAAFCSLNVMMFSYPLYATYFSYEPEGWGDLLGWFSLAFSLPVITYSAWPIFRRFYSSLLTGLYGMESLVVIGTLSALVLSLYNLMQGSNEVYFDTLTVLIALVLFGKIIESKTKLSAKEAFYTLSRSLPQRARKNGVFVSIKDINPGDVIECLTGERVPLDGLIEKGEALINESARTGESLPLLKKQGDNIEAGCSLESGTLSIRIVEGTSFLERIVETCMLNIEHKSQYIRVLDPLVRLFVPAVLLYALIIYVATGSLPHVLAVLLISCPCAIGIAAPLVESRLIQKLAEEGAIIRNRGALFKLPSINLWAFDKTGTLTEGNLQVFGLELLSDVERSLLKSLAVKSCHPVSRALSLAIVEQEHPLDDIFEIQGEGVRGRHQENPLYLGSAKFMAKQNIALPIIEDNTTEVWFYCEQKVIRITLHDKTKEEAHQVLTKLQPTLILSGDKKGRVEVVAIEVGAENFRGELSPTEKQLAIRAYKKQNQHVCFVGDGLNDAPALTEADIGIATASSLGLAQAACDILLTTPSLNVLLTLKDLSKKATRLIHQNLFWAFIYNVVGLVLAGVGLLTPIFAAFAMTASSLIVIVNSMRLKPAPKNRH